MDTADPRPDAAPRGPLPRYHVDPNWLDPATYREFLGYILANQGGFERGQVHGGYRPARRACLNLPLPRSDPWHERLSAVILGRLPRLFEQLSIKPVEIRGTELEISAYNDGAFFVPHIDTVTGKPGRGSGRIISGVFYLYVEPRAFAGGELRFYRFGSSGGDGEDHVDFSPAANSCVFFPSWAPHEVRPVRCSSGRFEDSRFAVNIWLHGRPGGKAAVSA